MWREEGLNRESILSRVGYYWRHEILEEVVSFKGLKEGLSNKGK